MGALKVWDGTAWQIAAGGGGGTTTYVGPDAPPGTPATGDQWFDTDDVSAGFVLPLSVANGGTGGTSPTMARSGLSVPYVGNSTTTAGGPTTGTYVKGDQWLDNGNVLWICTVAGSPGTWVSSPGTEHYYSEITADVTITATTAVTATVVMAGAAVTYDGKPIIVEFHTPGVILPPIVNGGVYVHIWDGSTDLGAALIYNNPAASANYVPGYFRRRLVPVAGSHTYSIRAWMPNGASGSATVTGRTSIPGNLGLRPYELRGHDMGALKVWDGAAWQTVAGQGRPGSNVFVGPSTPPGTPTSGDMWYDTDEVSGLTLPLTLANGGTGGTSALTARTSLAVGAMGNTTGTPGAPTTGTWARGDQWLDSAGVVWTCTVAGSPGTWMPPIGCELAYDQIVAPVSVPIAVTNVITGTTRSYDGSPVLLEFYSPRVDAPIGTQTLLNLADGATNLGYFVLVLGNGATTTVGVAQFARRRLTPTPGTHTFNIVGNAGAATGGAVQAGPGNTGTAFSPAFLRITRA